MKYRRNRYEKKSLELFHFVAGYFSFEYRTKGKGAGSEKAPGPCRPGKGRICGILLAFLVTAVFLAGWACERKTVLIPPQYSTPVPEAPSGPSRQGASVQPEPLPVAPDITSPVPPAQPPVASAPVQKQAEAKPAPKPAATQQAEKREKQEAAVSPKRQASTQKVNQARGQLDRGRTDSAIRTLEGAVRIDASNGEAFTLLARAWKQKGDRRKALEFAKKAELLYQKQPSKLRDVYLLESDLYHELGDNAKAGMLRRKASGGRQKPSE